MLKQMTGFGFPRGAADLFGQGLGQMPGGDIRISTKPLKTGRTMGDDFRAGTIAVHPHLGQRPLFSPQHGIRNVRPTQRQGARFRAAMGNGDDMVSKCCQDVLSPTIQGIMAGPMIEAGYGPIDGKSGLLDESADILNPASENFLDVHPVQGFPTGAATDDTGIEMEIPQHLLNLAEDDRILKDLSVLDIGSGIYLSRISTAQKGRRQYHTGAGFQ